MESYLNRAIADKHIIIAPQGKGERIVYAAVGRSERWSDPEEKVRAEYYSELIYQYRYPPARIGIEVVVPDRTPYDTADIVIFSDDERKRPYAVIECKAETYGGRPISDAVFNQAVEQAWGNGNAHKFRAKYIGVVAGATRRFLNCDDRYGALERDQNQIADLPIAYGRPPAYKYARGPNEGTRDISPVDKGELIAAIDKTHQTLWGGGRLSPPAAFGEFCKIIFVKVRDEKRVEESAPGTPYEFQVHTDESAAELGERIRALYEREMIREPDVFSERIKVDDATLNMCVAHLEGINFTRTDLDTKGVAFERFLDGFFKGDFGQYFTPREIIQFAIAMMPPCSDDMVLDTSCGSGGFLLYSMDHVRQATAQISNEVTRYRKWHDFAEKRLFGIEINDEINRVAKMNMILHDDGHTNIVSADALDEWQTLQALNVKLKPGNFDLVLTNPPFGAVVKASEKGSVFLDRFELSRYAARQSGGDGERQRAGKAALKQRASVKTEILFLERIHDFMKPGTGRAGIVVPDGILTNSSLQGVRDWLTDHFQMLAVVSLPGEAFQHSGANVKASMLFVRRRSEGEKPSDSEAIFMAAPQNIGYDAAGRDTVSVEIIGPGSSGDERWVRRSHDLFTYEALECRSASGVWEESDREPPRQDAGVIGYFRAFEAGAAGDPAGGATEALSSVLAGLESYVVGDDRAAQLDLTPAPFAVVTLGAIRGRRLDANAYVSFTFNPDDAPFPVKRLSVLADVNCHTTPAGYDDNAEVPYIGLPECDLHSVREIATRSFRDVKGRAVAHVGDLLFSRIEPSVFNKKYIPVDDLRGNAFAFLSTEFFALTIRGDKDDATFLFLMLLSDFVQRQIRGKTTGTSGRRRLDKEMLQSLLIPWPERDIRVHIARDVESRRSTAKQLRANAKKDWLSATKAIEGAFASQGQS